MTLTIAIHHGGGPTPGQWDAIVITAFIVFALLVLYIPAWLDWRRNG